MLISGKTNGDLLIDSCGCSGIPKRSGLTKRFRRQVKKRARRQEERFLRKEVW